MSSKARIVAGHVVKVVDEKKGNKMLGHTRTYFDYNQKRRNTKAHRESINAIHTDYKVLPPLKEYPWTPKPSTWHPPLHE